MFKNVSFAIIITALLFVSGSLHAGPDPLKKVAAELADAIDRHGKTTIAVLAVPHHDNHFSDGPFMVSERLATYLAKDKRLLVIERNQMLQLLRELHLSETGVLDLKTAKRIGEVLGADVIVAGTLIDLADGKTEINARGLLSKNGRIIAASRALLERTWEAQRRLDW